MNLVRTTQVVITSILLLLLGGIGGYYFGQKGYEVALRTKDRPITIQNRENAISSEVDFAQFWNVWNLVNQKHIRRPLDPKKLLDGAIHGMVEGIGDPYTSYFNVEENKMSKESLNGKYEGIGAQLDLDENRNLIIVAPLDGSPAERLGIKAGDYIVKIDDTETHGTTVEQAVQKIRGKAGTSVKLTLIRKGLDQPLELTVPRETITVKSVKWEDKGAGIAYIRISRFGEDTNDEWAKASYEIATQMPNLRGIIVDVRSNPGGYLESAVYISSDFVSKGVVVSEDFSDGTKNPYEVDHRGRFLDPKVNVAVLVDRGSASAAEIVTGALKERRGAIIVGERSFGKGSVQKPEDFDDGSSLHVTIAKWVTPDGNWVDKANSEYKDSVYNETKDGKEIKGGFKPDYEVLISDEDVKNKKDTQLDKAFELLNKEGK